MVEENLNVGVMKFEEGEENIIDFNDQNSNKTPSESLDDFEAMLHVTLIEKTENFNAMQERVYECLKCHFQSDKKAELMEHITYSDQGCSDLYDLKHQCSICARKFFTDILKGQHVMKEHKDICANNKCPQCPLPKKYFDTSTAYEKHLRTHHESTGFVCKICKKGFYSCDLMLQHVKSAHESCEWIYCDICEFKTKYKSLIRSHLKTHNKANNNVCKLCCKVVWDLNSHTFFVHKISGNECYYCKKCSYCALTRVKFKQHIEQCTGPKSEWIKITQR
jgi:KRAB domain-containing zinc finger protein